MKLELLMLADYAYVDHDGRFSIIRGGIAAFDAATLPHVVPTLSIAMQLDFNPDEQGAQHVVDVLISHAASRHLVLQNLISIVAAPGRGVPAATSVPLVLNIQKLELPEAGSYDVVIKQGAMELGVAHFTVRRTAPGPAPRVETIQGFNEAVAAYQAGDIAGAIDILRKLVAEYPTVAMGHNNLGFTLLAAGQVAEGLAHLQRAEDLQFDRQDVLRMNMACAHYGLGHYGDAAQRLRSLTEPGVFIAGAFLLGICETGLFQAGVSTELEYSQLALLNNAWAEFRMGKLPSVAALVRRLRTSPLTALKELPQFSASLAALTSIG